MSPRLSREALQLLDQATTERRPHLHWITAPLGSLDHLLAVDQGLKLGKQGAKGLKGALVPFREIPNARKVVKALEALRLGG